MADCFPAALACLLQDSTAYNAYTNTRACLDAPGTAQSASLPAFLNLTCPVWGSTPTSTVWLAVWRKGEW